MNSPVSAIPALAWIALVALNFAVQGIDFASERRGRAYAVKRITTPMLLFGALVLAWIRAGSFPGLPGGILLAMGLGEIGIEGSPVVQNGEMPERTPWTVTAAGLLFLGVNLVLGVALLGSSGGRPTAILGALAGGVVFAGVLDVLVLRFGRNAAAQRTNLILYSAGLAVLAAGVLADAAGGFGALGRAAALLTVSDSLVLIRMGAGWRRENPSERRILGAFLAVILILYVLFMASLATRL